MSIIVTLDAAVREILREVVREEVQSALAEDTRHGAPRSGRWMTPPRAAREASISEKSVRHMIKSGLIVARIRNIAANPKQPKYLVNADDVIAVAQRSVAPGEQDTASSLTDRAARIRAKTAGR